jgi:hypothetical protein
MTRYKPKSWWHEQRDARWARMHRNGMSYVNIAMREHHNPDYVSVRVRGWEAANAIDK